MERERRGREEERGSERDREMKGEKDEYEIIKESERESGAGESERGGRARQR